MTVQPSRVVVCSSRPEWPLCSWERPCVSALVKSGTSPGATGQRVSPTWSSRPSPEDPTFTASADIMLSVSRSPPHARRGRQPAENWGVSPVRPLPPSSTVSAAACLCRLLSGCAEQVPPEESGPRSRASSSICPCLAVTPWRSGGFCDLVRVFLQGSCKGSTRFHLLSPVLFGYSG